MSRATNEWAGQSVSQGRYLVRAQLGQGGMGFVYRALDRNLDSDVVIKVPRRSLLEDPDFATRFAREVRSLVKLAHPNIVKVTDVGEHEDVPFAVMQYLSGGSLEDYAADRGGAAFPLNLAALGEWLPGVARALDFVHSQGYVHRDVKPGNILFDAHGHVFLSDFGVAKALAAETEDGPRRDQTAVTGAGLVVGTSAYMAPELIMGKRFDGRIDQYALAVTVFEMLAGRRPFEGPTPTACMVMHTTQPPPQLCLVEPRISLALSDAVDRALSKDPDRRFPNCAAFAAAVVSGLATTAEAVKAPSGRTARPDQVRLPCPACEKSLVFPASLLGDPEKARGKRLSCPSCKTHLRVADDGRALVIAASSASSGLHGPQPDRPATLKLNSPRPATVPVARPPATPTVPVARPARTPTVQQSAPPPSNPAATVQMAVPPPSPPPAARFGGAIAVPGWAVAAGIMGGVLAAALVMLIVVPKLSGPRSGRVLIDTSSVPDGARFALDGRQYDPAAFEKFLDLAPGVHELSVTRKDYEGYHIRFPVSAGDNPGFKVSLARLPAPAVEKAPVAVASVGPEKGKGKEPEARPRAEAQDEPPPPAPPVASVVVRKRPRSVPLPPPPPPPPDLARRVDRPETTPGRFRPVPGGPAVDRHSLGELLGKPETFADSIVVPTGLYVLGPLTLGNPDGTASTTATRVALHVRTNALAFLEPADPPLTIEVDPLLAANLSHLGNTVVRHPQNTVIGIWHNTSTVLTFHVQQRTDGSGSPGEWVPVLKKVEFLVGMNFPRVGEGNFKDSFRTITASSTALPAQGLSDRHDWKTRLGVPYLAHLHRYFQNIKDAHFMREMQVMNNAMAPAINNMIRNNVSPATILDAQIRMAR